MNTLVVLGLTTQATVLRGKKQSSTFFSPTWPSEQFSI